MKWTSYQRDWVRDRSRLRLWVKSRRIGASWIAMLEAAADGIGRSLYTWQNDPSKAVPTLIVSTGQRYAEDLISRVAEHLTVWGEDDGTSYIRAQSLDRIVTTAGAQILALPGSNPAAARGWAGNVVCDEGAQTIDEELWAALKPIADPHLGRRSGYRISIVTTPAGTSGVVYEIAECGAGGDAWSRHRVDIHQAIEAGMPLDAAQIRAEMADDAAFAREYECRFDAGGSFIPAEAIEACIVDAEARDWGPVSAGYDCARSASGDAAALVVGRVAGKALHLMVANEAKGVPWGQQRAGLLELVDSHASIRVCIDSTGSGSMLAEELRHARGGKIMPIVFTGGSGGEREKLLDDLRRAVLERRLLIPRRLASKLRPQLSAIRREVTSTGAIRLILPRAASGHCDLAVSAALAVRAMRGAGVDYTPLHGPPTVMGGLLASMRGEKASDVGEVYWTTRSGQIAGYAGGRAPSTAPKRVRDYY